MLPTYTTLRPSMFNVLNIGIQLVVVIVEWAKSNSSNTFLFNVEELICRILSINSQRLTRLS